MNRETKVTNEVEEAIRKEFNMIWTYAQFDVYLPKIVAAIQPISLPLIEDKGEEAINMLNVKTAEDWYMKRLEKLQALVETAFIEGYKRRNSNNYSADWKEFVKQHEEIITF